MGCTIFGYLLDCYLASILIGSQLWSSSVCELVAGYNIDTSPSVTVQRGLCVHVPCSFSVPSDVKLSISTTGIWYHLYNGIGHPVTSKNNSVLKTNGHFFLTGNVSNGDCSYSIEDPSPMHEGIYYFRFEDEDSQKFNYQDIQPYVNVTELTDKATISSTRLVDGEEVTLTCTSPGRCRHIRPQITWEGPMTDIRQKMYDVTYGDGSRTFHSNITFTPRKSHNNSALFCKVTFKSNLTTVQKRTMNVVWSELHFIAVMGAAVGGFLFFMLILIGAFLIKLFRKTRRKNIKENLKNSETPEDTVPEDVPFTAGEDSMDMTTGDMQYASIDFSKLKPKEDVNENMETEYSEIKKTQQDE